MNENESENLIHSHSFSLLKFQQAFQPIFGWGNKRSSQWEWMRFSHSFSPLLFFWQKEGARENEWEWMRFSHSFSLFQFFFRKNSLFFFPVSPPILPKKEKGRMNEVFSFILPFAFFGQKERGKGEWMREYHLFSRFIFFTLCTRLWGWAYMMGHFFLRRVASYLVVVLVVVDDNVDDDDDVFVISARFGLGRGLLLCFFSPTHCVVSFCCCCCWWCGCVLGGELAYIVLVCFSPTRCVVSCSFCCCCCCCCCFDV